MRIRTVRRHGRHLVLLAVAGMAAHCVQAQQVYKWKDAGGTVHYSEQPPPAGVRSSTVHLSGDAAPGAPPPATARPVTPASAQAPAVAVDQAQQQRLCQTAQDNLKLLSGKAVVVDGNDISQARQLDEAQRAKAREEAQAQIGQYCNGK